MSPKAPRPGQLYLVSTPIGNLGDITLRAVQTLKSAARIAAEDTRRTRALLSHLGISGKPLTKLDAHASPAVLDRLLDHVEAGDDVAVVTDAGMPGISDPGTALVARAAERNLPHTVLPGASAVTSAVTLSGLVPGPFTFLGFLPRTGTRRTSQIASIEKSPHAVVLFESPERIKKTLADLARAMPERPACLCRELTKLHEELLRGTLSELASSERTFRGEITLVVAASVERPPQIAGPELDQRIDAELRKGTPANALAKNLAAETGLKKSVLYSRILKRRELAREND